MTNVSSEGLLAHSESVQAQVREVKAELRGLMNGPVSQSMRAKGLAYRVIFGVELPRLVAMAQTLPHDYALAAALWLEDIRECRLLAAMLMPAERMDAELADVWLEQMHYPEEAEACVLYLWSRCAWASGYVFRLLSDERPLARYAGYTLLRRLFALGRRLTTRDAQEFLDHAAADLHGERRLLQTAAYKTLLRYADCGLPEQRMAEGLMGGVV